MLQKLREELNICNRPYTQGESQDRLIAHASDTPDVSDVKEDDPTTPATHSATAWMWALAATVVVAIVIACLYHVMAHQSDPLINLPRV